MFKNPQLDCAMVNAGWFIGTLRERAAKLEMQRDSVFSAYARYGQYVSLGYDCEEAKSAKEAGVAKKQTKKTKGGARTSRPAGPLAARYNLEPRTARGDAVRSVLASQGIRAKSVSTTMLNDPVGAIAGLPGFHHSSKSFSGEVPEVEFMLLSGIAGKQLDKLLAAMREANCSVGCKAQVTQHNRLWPFAMLVGEVAREHAAMTAASADSDGNDNNGSSS